MLEFEDTQHPLVDFGPIEDKSVNIIKVIGVGGGGCNAVGNMYREGIRDVTFAVCNTDSQALSKSPVPVKIPIDELGAGGNPEKGRQAAQEHIDDIKKLLNDGTKMVFVTAGMGGGTGTGAAPVIAGVAKSLKILTIGIITIPFFFEKRNKIIKAIKGVEEMRKNVDALLIINNERICDIYSDTQISIKESFKRADQILCNATKSISELITKEGVINVDFRDVETTLRGGGGAIMAIGRASGEHRVEKAIIDALDSPLLYGNDIDKAKRILFIIYTSDQRPLLVSEMNEIDAFMDAMNPDIEVIWGVSDDDILQDDAKITILATGFDEPSYTHQVDQRQISTDEHIDTLIDQLYKPYKKQVWDFEHMKPKEIIPNIEQATADIPLEISIGTDEPTASPAPTSLTESVSVEEGKSTPSSIHSEEDEPPTASIHSAANERSHKEPEKQPTPPAGKPIRQFSFIERAKILMEKITELTQDPKE